jgi:hypothetical protein
MEGLDLSGDAGEPDRQDALHDPWDDGLDPAADRDAGDPDSDGEEDAALDFIPVCGNGIVEGDEACDTAVAEPCTTGCGSIGLRTCDACAWGPCDLQPETCNGMDDDCDGFVDAYAPTGPELRVTHAPEPSIAPRVFYTGSEFGIVWADYRRGGCMVTYTRLSTDGVKLSDDMSISETADSQCYDFIDTIFTGSELMSMWMSIGQDLYIARFLPDGEIVLAETWLAHPGTPVARPSLAFTGSHIAFTWSNRANELLLSRMTPDGERVGEDVPVSDDVAHYGGLVFLAGSEFGVLWSRYLPDDPMVVEIFLSRFSLEGVRIADDVQVGTIRMCLEGYGTYPAQVVSALFQGGRYSLLWQDGRHGDACEIYFSRVALDGSIITGDTRITSSPESDVDPYMIYADGAYALAWRTAIPSREAVFFTRLSDDGTLVEPAIEISDVREAPTSIPMYPFVSAAFTGDRYAVAWFDRRGDNWEIYASILGCIP